MPDPEHSLPTTTLIVLAIVPVQDAPNKTQPQLATPAGNPSWQPQQATPTGNPNRQPQQATPTGNRALNRAITLD